MADTEFLQIGVFNFIYTDNKMSVSSLMVCWCTVRTYGYSTCYTKAGLWAMRMTALQAWCCPWWFQTSRQLMKTGNVEVGLKSIQSSLWDTRGGPTVGTFDSGWIDMFLSWKFVEAIRAECMMAWQELGLMGLVIIWLFADATVKEFLWVVGVKWLASHGYQMRISMVRFKPDAESFPDLLGLGVPCFTSRLQHWK